METLYKICDVVHRETGVDIILQNARTRNVVDAKRIYSKIARDLTKYSFDKIGKVVNKNHATVAIALQEVYIMIV